MPLSTEALIAHSAKRLVGLGRSEQVSNFARQNPRLVDTFITEFDLAVTELNSWFQDVPLMLLLAPKAKELQPYLGFPPVKLPTIAEMRSNSIWARYGIRGLREERKLLAAGEADTDGKLLGSEKILYSSFDNTNEAYALGAIGHTWERTCVAYLRDHPPIDPFWPITDHDWQKDELLVPLEDVVVLGGVQGDESIANIFRVMSTPPNPVNGGLGWITKERVDFTREMLKI